MKQNTEEINSERGTLKVSQEVVDWFWDEQRRLRKCGKGRLPFGKIVERMMVIYEAFGGLSDESLKLIHEAAAINNEFILGVSTTAEMLVSKNTEVPVKNLAPRKKS
jgi:hypothetical protein